MCAFLSLISLALGLVSTAPVAGENEKVQSLVLCLQLVCLERPRPPKRRQGRGLQGVWSAQLTFAAFLSLPN